MSNINDNNFQVDIALDKRMLNAIIHDQLNTSLTQPITLEGFSIHLKPHDVSEGDFFVHRKTMYVTLPLQVKLEKKDGIFSISANGNMKIKLEIAFDIETNLKVWTETSIKSYEWTSPPEVSLGTLEIGVEKISNWVLDFFKEKVADKIDLQIQAQLDLQKLITQKFEAYSQNLKVNAEPAMYLNGELVSIKAYELSSSPESILVKILLEVILKVADKKLDFPIDNNPTFEWVSNPNSPIVQRIEIDHSWTNLALEVMKKVNGLVIGGKTFQLESINFRYTDRLEIKANIVQPLKGIMTITGVPQLDADAQVILIDDLNIDIKAENLIYRLSSPVIEKIIMTKIESFFPLQLQPYAEQFKGIIVAQQPVMNGFVIIPSVDNITLERLKLDPQKASAVISLDNASLTINSKVAIS